MAAISATEMNLTPVPDLDEIFRQFIDDDTFPCVGPSQHWSAALLKRTSLVCWATAAMTSRSWTGFLGLLP